MVQNSVSIKGNIMEILLPMQVPVSFLGSNQCP